MRINHFEKSFQGPKGIIHIVPVNRLGPLQPVTFSKSVQVRSISYLTAIRIRMIRAIVQPNKSYVPIFGPEVKPNFERIPL